MKNQKPIESIDYYLFNSLSRGHTYCGRGRQRVGPFLADSLLSLWETINRLTINSWKENQWNYYLVLVLVRVEKHIFVNCLNKHLMKRLFVFQWIKVWFMSIIGLFKRIGIF